MKKRVSQNKPDCIHSFEILIHFDNIAAFQFRFCGLFGHAQLDTLHGEQDSKQPSKYTKICKDFNIFCEHELLLGLVGKDGGGGENCSEFIKLQLSDQVLLIVSFNWLGLSCCSLVNVFWKFLVANIFSRVHEPNCSLVLLPLVLL